MVRVRVRVDHRLQREAAGGEVVAIGLDLRDVRIDQNRLLVRFQDV